MVVGKYNVFILSHSRFTIEVPSKLHILSLFQAMTFAVISHPKPIPSAKFQYYFIFLLQNIFLFTSKKNLMPQRFCFPKKPCNNIFGTKERRTGRKSTSKRCHHFKRSLKVHSFYGEWDVECSF